MRAFRIVTAGSVPGIVLFGKSLTGFKINFTNKYTAIIGTVVISLTVFIKEEGRVDTSKVKENRLGPFTGNILGSYIEVSVFVTGTADISYHTIKPSFVITYGRCK